MPGPVPELTARRANVEALTHMETTVIWGPGIGGPILLIQITLVLIATVRLVNSARSLYLRWGKRFLPEDVLTGGVDSDRLAASALANRLPCRALLQKGADLEFSREAADPGKVFYTLGVADSRFLYLWERYRADVDSARRAALLVFLLSMVAAAYSAFPIYFGHFNNNTHGGFWSAFWTVKDLFMLLGYGWSCCAVLCLASSFFDRALANRKACWNFFCSRLKNELSRQ